MTNSTRRRLAAIAALTLLVIGAMACSRSDDAGGDDSGGGAGPDPALARGEQEQPAAESAGGEFQAASSDGVKGAESAALQQAVISNGNVAMKSDDVGQSIFDVRKVVDLYRGQVEEDTTETDDDGDPLRSRMVLRIPSGQFHKAMDDLEKVATLITSSSNSKDVTTTVIDKRVRMQMQRRSIARISVLLDRAVSIRDIVNIEAQLTHRQSELASLERQLRYLADQTSMSTITVSIERAREKPTPKEEKDDDTGFLAGLAAGWDGLKTFGTGLATVLGALLPWLVTLAILAIPGWPLMRRLRRREPATLPEPSPTSG